MSELPDGWIKVPLAEVNEFSGGTVNPASRPDELFELYSVPSFPTGRPERLLGSEIGSTKQTVEAGDVLISKINPRINRVWTVGPKLSEEQIASSEWIGFRSEAVKPAFANYYFRSQEFRDLLCSEVAGVGGSLTRAQPKRVAAYPLPIAPLAEQTRIADQLDTLLARVNACNDRLNAIPGILKRFRQAVFDTAITGGFTRAWRDARGRYTSEKSAIPEWAEKKGLHGLPEGWRWSRFSEFISSIRSGTSAVPSGELSAYPVLRSSSVRAMDIDFDDVRYLPNLIKVRPDDLLEDGDVLFTRLSGSLDYVANCAAVRGLCGRQIYYPDRLFRAKLIHPEQGSYFELCFSSPLLRECLTVEAKSTAGHQRISMGAVTDFPIPLPPNAEQQEIIRQVEIFLGLADRIEARYTAMRSLVQCVAPQVLAKAFSGELVEQDPSDEPANALLARLRTKRATSSTEKAPRRPRQPRITRAPAQASSMTKSRQDEDVKGKPYLASHLRRLGVPTTAQSLFKEAELPVADFYKQLAWEIAEGHVKDNQTTLEPGHATG